MWQSAVPQNNVEAPRSSQQTACEKNDIRIFAPNDCQHLGVSAPSMKPNRIEVIFPEGISEERVRGVAQYCESPECNTEVRTGKDDRRSIMVMYTFDDDRQKLKRRIDALKQLMQNIFSARCAIVPVG